MDISGIYIKMCDRAEEIQKLCPEELSEKDFSVILPPSEEEERKLPRFKIICGTFVWLPRQDQLQEMVEEKPITLIALLNGFLTDFMVPIYENSEIMEFPKSFPQQPSMEQLWLAFVMKEKYGKTWNGEKWVKEEKK